MANLLQSTQTQATTAPEWYTKYLTGISQAAQGAIPTNVTAPQYVGAQPLQNLAFQTIGQMFGQPQAGAIQQPTPPVVTPPGDGGPIGFPEADMRMSPLSVSQDVTAPTGGLPNLGLGQDISAAAARYMNTAYGSSPAELAAEYMNPYTKTAVQSMSDIAQRNIMQNLAPQATAAAVGSGQYGSQRGAQVLGQVQAQAQQDLNNQIAQMLTSGYGQALTAAGQRQGQLAQMGQIAGQLGTAEAQQRIANLNALSTLGGQQQTIAQNQQMFPLTTLSNVASMLQGYQYPTTVSTQLNMSPLSALGAAGATLAGLFTPTTVGGQTTTPWGQLSSTIGGALGGASDWLKNILNPGGTPTVDGGYVDPDVLGI